MNRLKITLLNTEQSVSEIFLDDFFEAQCDFTYFEANDDVKNITYPLCLQSVFSLFQ